MSTESSNPTSHPPQYDRHIQSLKAWIDQQNISWNHLFLSLWTSAKELDENASLTIMLQDTFTGEGGNLFTNKELILQILEEQPFDWHNQDKYMTLYEQTLEDLLPSPVAESLMKFLAGIRVGIRPDFFRSIQKQITDQDQLLELQLLSVLRSQQLNDTEQLNNWTVAAKATIAKYNHKASSDNWLNAVYQLPILGLLLYKNKPGEFLKYCRDVSYAVQPIDGYEKLNRHLQLYYRNAVLKVCKNNAWQLLAEIKKHNTGWAADFFDWSLQAPSMQGYADQLAQWENKEVVSLMEGYNSELTVKKLDDLAKPLKNR